VVEVLFNCLDKRVNGLASCPLQVGGIGLRIFGSTVLLLTELLAV